jgi:serine/threonine protein kinase
MQVTPYGVHPGATEPLCSHIDLLNSFASSKAVAKVSDFGLSKRMKMNEDYLPNIRQGTPFFMAPELSSQYQLHPQSDVYGYGVMMWELMMGVPVSLEMCDHPCCLCTSCADTSPHATCCWMRTRHLVPRDPANAFEHEMCAPLPNTWQPAAGFPSEKKNPRSTCRAGTQTDTARPQQATTAPSSTRTGLPPPSCRPPLHPLVSSCAAPLPR